MSKSKHMTAGRFICEYIAVLLHTKTCKYSLTSTTCQAEEDCFVFGGLNGSHYVMYICVLLFDPYIIT